MTIGDVLESPRFTTCRTSLRLRDPFLGEKPSLSPVMSLEFAPAEVGWIFNGISWDSKVCWDHIPTRPCTPSPCLPHNHAHEQQPLNLPHMHAHTNALSSSITSWSCPVSQVCCRRTCESFAGATRACDQEGGKQQLHYPRSRGGATQKLKHT